jgi:hypothetical protein
MWILRGNWELWIFCILRKMCWLVPLYFLCATCRSALRILCNICGLLSCLQFMRETLISVGDCIMYILRGTSKLNYQNNRHQVVKELHTNILHKGHLFFISVLDQCCGSVTFWTFYLWKMTWMYLQKGKKNYFLLASWRIRIRIRIRTSKDESGSGRSKNIRIWIHNTVLDLLQKFLPCVQLHSMAYPDAIAFFGIPRFRGYFWQWLKDVSPPPYKKWDKLTSFWLPDL